MGTIAAFLNLYIGNIWNLHTLNKFKKELCQIQISYSNFKFKFQFVHKQSSVKHSHAQHQYMVCSCFCMTVTELSCDREHMWCDILTDSHPCSLHYESHWHNCDVMVLQVPCILPYYNTAFLNYQCTCPKKKEDKWMFSVMLWRPGGGILLLN